MPYPQRVAIAGARLERWDPARHTASLHRMNGDPEVMRFLQPVMAPAQVDAMSARIAAHWEEHGFGLWAVVPDADALGFVGACRPAWSPEYAHRVELAWRLEARAWGRGYATAGARRAAELCFSELGLDEVLAFIDAENERSHGVARRLGMRALGSSTEPRSGKPLELLALTARDLAAAPAVSG